MAKQGRKQTPPQTARISDVQLPIFKHDCDKCIYLGSWRGVAFDWALKHGKKSEEDFDLYLCTNPSHPTLNNWLARYGGGAAQYLSSHPPAAFARGYTQQPWEKEIEKRIKEKFK